MVVNIIKKLAEIGLSEYEAKAYTALVSASQATAYEIARLSGIPTSKIYEVISKLLDKGIVSIIDMGKKKRYIPIDPAEFIESRRTRLETTLDGLKKDLSSIQSETDISYIWNVNDYEFLMEKANRMAESAEKNLLISGWNEELAFLENNLLKKEREKVRIAIVHFGRVHIKVGQIFQHPIEDTIYNEKGGRGLLIIVDSKEALMGTVFFDNKVEGAWSINKGFVTLAEDYVKHDIYIMKIVNRFEEELIGRFGENYIKLRDIFNDEETGK
ncbi:TrmB family transcriptional regulator [Thermodesulfobacteriota bacterium]